MTSMDRYRAFAQTCLIAAVVPAFACSGCDEDEGGTAADTVLIDGSIGEDRVLENIIEDPEIADYIVVSKNIAVSASLTVEPGVRIEFESGTLLEVTGSLTAIGTEEEPIVFTGETAQPGAWKGLYIKSDDVTNELTWTIVEYGGQDGQPGIDGVANVGLGTDARLKVTNSVFRHGLEYGMTTRSNNDLSGFEDNTFTENGAGPAILEINSVGYIDAGSSFAGNEEGWLSVSEATLSEDATWPAIDVPYRLVGKRNVVSGAWALEAGVTVEMSSNAYIEVAGGSVNAVGTSDAPITFTGVTKEPGAWRVLSLDSNDTANEFVNCVFEHSGSERLAGLDGSAALGLKRGASATVTDSTFRDNAGWGIWAEPEVTLTESGNTFENNELGDIGM